MASPYLTYPSLVDNSIDGGYVQNPLLTQLSSVFLLSACVYLKEKWLWQSTIEPISDFEYQSILEMIEQCEAQLMTNVFIGQIFASVTDLSAYDTFLLLDGSLVSQAMYPDLAATVPASWLVGSDIQLPDMFESSLHGQDGANIGAIVGENDVTLDISQIPSHNHTQNPHAHSEVIPSVTPTGAGPIAAAASVVLPIPSTTGFTTATNNAAGGDGSHNNVPRSLAVNWWIVAI